MSEDDLRELIFNAVHRVLRIPVLPSQADFYGSTVKSTVEFAEGPSLDANFWWDSVVVKVQSAALARKQYITEWTVEKLKSLEDSTWSSVFDHVDDNIGAST